MRRKPTNAGGRNLAPDGLPWPVKPLPLANQIVRRAVLGRWDGHMSAAADALGVSRTAVTHWVRGARSVPDEVLEALARKFGTTVGALFVTRPEVGCFAGREIGPGHPDYELWTQVMERTFGLRLSDYESPLAPNCTTYPESD